MTDLITPRQITKKALNANDSQPDVIESEAMRSWMDSITAFVNTPATVSPGPLIWSNTADVTIANTVVETSLFAPGTGSLTLAANALTVGKSIRVTMMGIGGSNNAQTSRYRMKLGGVTVIDTGAIAASSNQPAPEEWVLNAVLTCRATGAAGSVMGQMDAAFWKDGAAVLMQRYRVTAPVAVAIDTTVAQLIDLTLQWGTAAAANTVTVNNALVELL